jgi:hypothetical protein
MCSSASEVDNGRCMAFRRGDTQNKFLAVLIFAAASAVGVTSGDLASWMLGAELSTAPCSHSRNWYINMFVVLDLI